MEDSAHTPFQRLQFLVRDWSFPYDAPYGTEGGVQILDRRLQVGVRRAGGPGGEESCRQTDRQTHTEAHAAYPAGRWETGRAGRSGGSIIISELVSGDDGLVTLNIGDSIVSNEDSSVH